jgi:hypothetical protein
MQRSMLAHFGGSQVLARARPHRHDRSGYGDAQQQKNTARGTHGACGQNGFTTAKMTMGIISTVGTSFITR